MILAVNAGSSTIKFAIHDASPGLDRMLSGSISLSDGKAILSIGFGDGRPVAVESADAAEGLVGAFPMVFDQLHRLGWSQRIEAVGHRVVHGGIALVAPTRLDRETLDVLAELAPLAPVHQSAGLAGVGAAAAALPGAVQVGCFDTAFHSNQPHLARLYGLPRKMSEQGIIGYGFHGLSYAYIASVLRQRFGEGAGGRAIVAHLGSGVSLCAMCEGRSVATTMGFSTLDGPPMATRCGSLDPGVLLYLIQKRGMSVNAISDLLYRRSGLLGVSGISGDLRDLQESEQPAAQEAIDLFVYRVGREIGSLAAALGGLETFVFTAGVGENSPSVRARIAEAAAWLGITLDARANEAGDILISKGDARVAVLVVPTDEQRSIAQDVQAWLSRS